MKRRRGKNVHSWFLLLRLLPFLTSYFYVSFTLYIQFCLCLFLFFTWIDVFVHAIASSMHTQKKSEARSRKKRELKENFWYRDTYESTYMYTNITRSQKAAHDSTVNRLFFLLKFLTDDYYVLGMGNCEQISDELLTSITWCSRNVLYFQHSFASYAWWMVVYFLIIACIYHSFACYICKHLNLRHGSTRLRRLNVGSWMTTKRMRDLKKANDWILSFLLLYSWIFLQ